MNTAPFASFQNSHRLSVRLSFAIAAIGCVLVVLQVNRHAKPAPRPEKKLATKKAVVAQAISRMEYSLDGGDWYPVNGIINAKQRSVVYLRIIPKYPDAGWSSTPPEWITSRINEDNSTLTDGLDVLNVYCDSPDTKIQKVKVRYAHQTFEARIRVSPQYQMVATTNIGEISQTRPLLPGGGKYGHIQSHVWLETPNGERAVHIPVSFSIMSETGDKVFYTNETVTNKWGNASVDLKTEKGTGDCCLIVSAHIHKNNITITLPLSIDTPTSKFDLGSWQTLSNGTQRAHYQSKIYVDKLNRRMPVSNYPVSVRIHSANRVSDMPPYRIEPMHGKTDANGVFDGYVYRDASANSNLQGLPEPVLTLHDEIMKRDFPRK